MRISGSRIFTDGRFISGSIEFDQKIRSILPGKDEKADCAYIIPGLIDIHTHAAMGADASDGDPEGMLAMSRYYAAGGVTSWCPTTMTLKEPELTKAMQVIRDFRRPEDGAKAAGVNLEGPFVSYEKRGAQNPDNIALPDIGMLERLNEASGGLVRLITLAPELEGAMDFIRQAARICTVSLGHSAADYETAVKAYGAGASHTTHLFNAMPSLHHRNPGLIAAAFDCGASAELICDGFHVHPAMVRMAWQIFEERIVLISDSLRCAGMPDGEYSLGGQPVSMKDGKATLSGTDTLAGSSIHLMEGLRRAVKFGIPLRDAVRAATEIPARVIGIDSETGSISPGKAADLLLLDEQLNVLAVYVDGKRVR